MGFGSANSSQAYSVIARSGNRSEVNAPASEKLQQFRAFLGSPGRTG
jgi:hypothetical protein